MMRYRAAYYQQDTIDELSRQAQLFVYGPGHDYFDPNDSLDDVLGKGSIDFDCIISGHSWLSETDGQTTLCPNINLRQSELPLVGILNKEYNSLEGKLSYFSSNNFNLIFSHHTDIHALSDKYNFRSIFWPFAVADNRIPRQASKNSIDILFSGILQNRMRGVHQTNARRVAMKNIFHCLGDLPVRKRKEFSDFNIVWNAMPSTQSKTDRLLIYRALRLLFPQYGYHQFPIDNYFALLRKTRIVINTLSPSGLIGPRYFETMASGGMVFCEQSSSYERIFSGSTYISYRHDLSDFREKLLFFLTDDRARKQIAQEGQNAVLTQHKWSDRISVMLEQIKEILAGR